MDIQHTVPTKIKISIKAVVFILALLPAICFALPPEFTASYDLEKFGILAAKSNYSLKYENNGIRMLQHTEAAGFAALFRNDELDENSFLSVQGDLLLLTEFSYKQKSPDNKNRDIQLKIDWVQSENKLLGNVEGIASGKKFNLKTNKPVWDTCTYQIPLMLNTKEGSSPQKITMMVKGKLRKHTFITHNTEKIEINGNIIQTIKVERDPGKNKNPIYFWLAPELNNLPVKIEKWRNGKIELTMTLNQAIFPADEDKNFQPATTNTEELEDL
ncbi:MAG: DUF3108 domain-containing protein [Gammaproteobacteria bacterium]|nr:DUF3108 domain-containing protein [Gammaproteobacteria bacterium]